jgi:hypothetical protein
MTSPQGQPLVSIDIIGPRCHRVMARSRASVHGEDTVGRQRRLDRFPRETWRIFGDFPIFVVLACGDEVKEVCLARQIGSWPGFKLPFDVLRNYCVHCHSHLVVRITTSHAAALIAVGWKRS